MPIYGRAHPPGPMLFLSVARARHIHMRRTSWGLRGATCAHTGETALRRPLLLVYGQCTFKREQCNDFTEAPTPRRADAQTRGEPEPPTVTSDYTYRGSPHMLLASGAAASQSRLAPPPSELNKNLDAHRVWGCLVCHPHNCART